MRNAVTRRGRGEGRHRLPMGNNIAAAPTITTTTNSIPPIGASGGCSTTIVITPPPPHSEYFEELLLSEREKSGIQKSWTLSEQSTTLNVGQRLLQKIFANAPEAEQLFRIDLPPPSNSNVVEEEKKDSPSKKQPYNASFYRHIRSFMNLMEFAVSKIDDDDRGEKLWRTCFEVGKRHVKVKEIGFKEEYWRTFEIAMLECVVDWEGGQCSQRSVDSWSKLLGYVVRNMKSGYDYELARVQQMV